MTEWLNHVHIGDCRRLMRRMIADGVKVNCIVTSPPYWGLRCYGVNGQFGKEATWQHHVARMRSTFRLCRELLANDGTLWLNYGDSYSDGKDLMGMPWRVAFALQDDGWILRQDIIWAKPNPMPESIRDRCTKAHEYLFLFSKRERYYWDFAAMQEPAGTDDLRQPHGSPGTLTRQSGVRREQGAHARRAVLKTPDGWDTSTGEGAHGSFHKEGREKGHLPGNLTHKGTAAYEAGDESQRTKGGLVEYSRKLAAANSGIKSNESMDEALSELRQTRNRRDVWVIDSNPVISEDRKDLRPGESRHRSSIDGGQSMQEEPNGMRNRRDVWTVASEPFKAAHFATFPRALIEPCILAGSRPGDIVFDPFMGSGTVAEVAMSLGRRFIGTEINRHYVAMFKKYREQQLGFAFVTGEEEIC